MWLFTSCTKDIQEIQTSPPDQLENIEHNEIQTVVPSETIIEMSTEDVSVDVDISKDSSEGKIAIVSGWPDGDMSFETVSQIVSKYGKDKILHTSWPHYSMIDNEVMIDTIISLRSDPDIKAVIVNPAIRGTNNALKKLKETGRPIFSIYCGLSDDDITETAGLADLILTTNELNIDTLMIKQAKKLGAKTFIHYSFPRHMSQTLLSQRRESIKQECDKLGVKFVDAIAPDPINDIGLNSAQQFIVGDVPKMVAEHGEDTAFFATDCALQIPLINAVVDAHALYPSPCHPSPFHGFPTALGLDCGEENTQISDAEKIMVDIWEVFASKNMLGRVSTWPVDPDMMLVEVSTEYAIKRLNGEVPQEGIDIEVLTQLMTDYAGVPVYLTPYTDPETGITYDNYLMMRMGYITFE